jgi:hypothetical protein
LAIVLIAPVFVFVVDVVVAHRSFIYDLTCHLPFTFQLGQETLFSRPGVFSE